MYEQPFSLRRLISPLVFTIVIGILAAGRADEIREAPQLAECFERHGFTGTFVLLDPATGKLTAFNLKRSQQRFVPASTFKIPNTLIGLDSGAVANVDELLPYGGKPQPFKHWEKDMNLREAIRESAVPIYQELARRIGLPTMRRKVHEFGFGNAETGEVVDRFWLDGPLAISAVEQTQFLARMLGGKLPVKPDAVTALKEITQQARTETYSLHAKTGWAMNQSPQIGWWVGWLEKRGQSFPFALNVDMKSDADGPKRAHLGKECLRKLLGVPEE
jgi:beta-lactamase class D